MVVDSVDSELAFAIENDVIVDGDLGFGPYRRRTDAVKRVWPAAYSDSITDALFGARKRSDATARLTGSRTVAARRTVLY
jgi:hypothetical protein